MRLTDANVAAREGRIGASEVAALLPCGSPWMTKADLYARLVHGVTRTTSRDMEMGHLLEETVFRLGKAQAGVSRARRNAHTYLHPSLPLAATPDGTVPGKPALVEVKLVSHWQTDDWIDGPPAYVVAQVQAQLMVTGKEFGHLWALMEGTRVVTYLIEADPDTHAFIAGAVSGFMAFFVEPRIPPPEALEDDWAMTVTALEGTVYADGDLLEYGRVLAALTAAEKAATKAKEEARGAMALAMAAAGASVVVAPEWRAEAKPAQTGKVGLWFYPRKEKAA